MTFGKLHDIRQCCSADLLFHDVKKKYVVLSNSLANKLEYGNIKKLMATYRASITFSDSLSYSLRAGGNYHAEKGTKHML